MLVLLVSSAEQRVDRLTSQERIRERLLEPLR
jgi:hypothetical protein